MCIIASHLSPPNILLFRLFLASLLSSNKIQYTSVAEQSQIGWHILRSQRDGNLHSVSPHPCADPMIECRVSLIECIFEARFYTKSRQTVIIYLNIYGLSPKYKIITKK
jgi:hypothetical protein